MTSYDLALEPPRVRALSDDPGTLCLGTNPSTGAYECDGRLVCHLCDGVVCTEHDDVADCGDGPAHEACHRQGCANAACEQDRADDALLERDDQS
jgi:hypothetical protein